MASYRKHVKHMTRDEAMYLWKKLYGVGSENWKLSKHFLDMLYERGGNKDDAINTIYNGGLVEYHQKDGSNRVLIRGEKKFMGEVMCVVFEPESQRVVTVYWNKYDDNHRTINMSAYIPTLDIIPTWESESLVLAS